MAGIGELELEAHLRHAIGPVCDEELRMFSLACPPGGRHVLARSTSRTSRVRDRAFTSMAATPSSCTSWDIVTHGLFGVIGAIAMSGFFSSPTLDVFR